jgi:hypothetical protein
VPVGGVLGRGAAGEVCQGPELVQPGKFPAGFGVVRPAGFELVGEVAGVLDTQDGFDPVGLLAELLSLFLLGHPDPESGGRGGVLGDVQVGEDRLDSTAQFGDGLLRLRLLSLLFGERVDPGYGGLQILPEVLIWMARATTVLPSWL